MSEKEDKLDQILADNPPDERAVAEEWLDENLDNNLHVKYNPNSKDSKSQLDAILADVNQGGLDIEENLKRDFYRNEILDSEVGEINFKSIFEDSNPSLIDDIPISNSSSNVKENFAEEEKRRKEIIFQNKKNNENPER